MGTDETRYRYDDNSNRTHIDNEEVASYDAQDRLLSYQDCDYHYTAYGDLQTRTCGTDISHYRYDLLGNLLSVAQGGQTIDYLVDGEGRRIGRRVDGVLESAYLYKDALNPVARLDNQGRISQRYIYASLGHVPDYLIAYTYSDEEATEAASSEAYKLIVDQLGSVRLVVRVSDGEVLQNMTYDAWGEVTQDSNPGFQPFGYAGGLYDADTGLVRFGARDYDAETGRWTSKDPILFDGGDTNLYGYVLNNPINFIDVWGLYPGERYVDYIGGAIGGTGDFIGAYMDMVNATHGVGYKHNGWVGQDKYFHCRANCEAAQRGEGGEAAAQCISNAREAFDQSTGDSKSASNADQAANQYGRSQGASNPVGDCKQLCEKYRPSGSFPF